MKLRGLPRFLTALILIGGSLLFLFPFLWLLLTSFKTVEQAMVMPPEWIPAAKYTTIEGTWMRVIPDRQIEVPSVIVSFPDKSKHLLPETDVCNAMVAVPGIEKGVRCLQKLPVTILSKVSVGDWYVVEWLPRGVLNRVPRWDCVAEKTLITKMHLETANYTEATTTIPFWRYTLNTLLVCVLGTIGVVLSSTLAAYGMSRIQWKGREVLFYITLATMMVPFPVTMVPLYGVYRTMGWIGTLKPLWLPYCFGSAFNIFLLRQFFRTIPNNLTDAARIDGCSEFAIFWRIILPLAKPAISVVALFHFMFAWKDFMGPLLYLTRQETFTLSLGLQFYQSRHGGSEWHLLMAAAVLVTLPILVLFFFTQKTFVQGINTTGMKG